MAISSALRTPIGRVWLPVLFLLAATAAAKAGDYAYVTNSDDTLTIIRPYNGSGGAIVIPLAIGGKVVASIGDHAFDGNPDANLTSVTIGNSITSIRNGAFWNCPGLIAITVDEGNPAYSSVEGILFDKSQTKLIQCPGGKAGSYAITNGVTSIGENAFESCTSLASVTIPNSVTSIGNGAIAFCTNLTSVTIGKGVTRIGGHAFWGCPNLTGVYFKGNAPSLDQQVFVDDHNATVYYLAGTTGWGPTFGGRPTAVWKP